MQHSFCVKDQSLLTCLSVLPSISSHPPFLPPILRSLTFSPSLPWYKFPDVSAIFLYERPVSTVQALPPYLPIPYPSFPYLLSISSLISMPWCLSSSFCAKDQSLLSGLPSVSPPSPWPLVSWTSSFTCPPWTEEDSSLCWRICSGLLKRNTWCFPRMMR